MLILSNLYSESNLEWTVVLKNMVRSRSTIHLCISFYYLCKIKKQIHFHRIKNIMALYYSHLLRLTTYGFSNDQEDVWPSYMHQEMGFWVQSCSCQGKVYRFQFKREQNNQTKKSQLKWLLSRFKRYLSCLFAQNT